MASSDPEIKDGFTLPVWMKTKPTREFEPFAGSPPAPEDSFFYIRYPKTDALFDKTVEDRPQVYAEKKELTAASAYNIVKEKDWSKHTKPCQKVLHGIAPVNTAVNSVTPKPKPAGTDDGFKGEGAACGTSVVKVAAQMVSMGRFTVASPEEDAASAAAYGRLSHRRGSKSLPATPLASPTARRKHTNRYFTSPFEPVEDASNRSWLTNALLGFKKDLATSTSTLAEEDTLETRLHGLAESVESLGPASKASKALEAQQVSQNSPQPRPKPAYRPKPTELRELNFWSPTSM